MKLQGLLNSQGWVPQARFVLLRSKVDKRAVLDCWWTSPLRRPHLDAQHLSDQAQQAQLAQAGAGGVQPVRIDTTEHGNSMTRASKPRLLYRGS